MKDDDASLGSRWIDPDGPSWTFGAVLREERKAGGVELTTPKPYESRLLRMDPKRDSEIDSEVDGILVGRMCVDDWTTSGLLEGKGSEMSKMSEACSSLKTSGSEGCRDLLLGIGGGDDCRIVFRSAIFCSWFFSARLAPGAAAEVFSKGL